MARRKKIRTFLGIIRDKASVIKAILSPNRTTSSIHVAVLRATTRCSSSPPPDHRIATVLRLGSSGSRPVACACVEAIMDRLHGTSTAYVAMKCLVTLHNLIKRGSFILKDQISFYPSAGGHNSLNLSMFSDKSDLEMWEFSSWVRWYAGFLERNLMTSRVLGCYFSFSPTAKMEIDKSAGSLTSLLNTDLVREIDALVCMVEEICRAPDDPRFQTNNFVYEVMKLVGEDYRLTQYHLMIRLTEFGDRIDLMSLKEASELSSCLNRLEESRERLTALFVNRNRNHAFWDLVRQTKVRVVKVKEDRENVTLLTWGRRDNERELTRSDQRVVGASRFVSLLPYAENWLSVDRVPVTVSTAMA